MQHAIQPHIEQSLISQKSKKKIALVAGIAGTFAVGALVGAQLGSDSSSQMVNLQSVSLYCSDIKASGQLRTLDRQCMTIDGTSKSPGTGSLHTGLCDGTGSQSYQYCSDGTFRSVAQNTCIAADGSKAEAYGCTGQRSYLWSLESQGTWTAPGTSVAQNVYSLKNQGSDDCLVVNANNSGSGSFAMGSCSSTDSHLYFQNNGQMISNGQMQNQSNSQCVQANTRSDTTENAALLVNNESCGDGSSTNAAQMWSYYENGSIVNGYTNWCLEPEEGSGNGAMAIYPCTGNTNQQWSLYDNDSDDVYVWKNAASKKCFQFSGAGNPQIESCNADPQQQFKMYPAGSGSWSTPIGQWSQNSCNESGNLSLSITQSVQYSASVTDTVTTSVSVAIKAGVSWGGVTTTESTSNAFSQQFSVTGSETITETFVCQYYAGTTTPFTSGCIFQSIISTNNLVSGSPLTFNSSYIACTPNNTPPTCPPMEQCANSACTECENYT